MTVRETIFKEFDKWMTLPDKSVLDVVCGSVLANRMDGLPIFLALIGPSSSGKSVVIESTNDLPDTYPLSKITPRTFASGFTGKKQASLLEELTSDHPWILTFKDFTTVLAMPKSEKGEIMAQLREIYDGEFVGRWGSTKKDVWKGRIGLILGCTGAWDKVAPEFGALGERFLVFRMPDVPDEQVADRGIRSSTDTETMEGDLRRAMCALDQIPIPPNGGPVPQIMYPDRQHLRLLAVMTARARTPVLRNYVTRQVEDLPEIEKPGRLAGQLAKLSEGIALFKGEPSVSEGTRETIDKVAIGSIPRERRIILKHLDFQGETVDSISQRLRLARSPIGRALQDMQLLGIAEVGPGGYRPTPSFESFFALARGHHRDTENGGEDYREDLATGEETGEEGGGVEDGTLSSTD